MGILKTHLQEGGCLILQVMRHLHLAGSCVPLMALRLYAPAGVPKHTCCSTSPPTDLSCSSLASTGHRQPASGPLPFARSLPLAIRVLASFLHPGSQRPCCCSDLRPAGRLLPSQCHPVRPHRLRSLHQTKLSLTALFYSPFSR